MQRVIVVAVVPVPSKPSQKSTGILNVHKFFRTDTTSVAAIPEAVEETRTTTFHRAPLMTAGAYTMSSIVVLKGAHTWSGVLVGH